MKANIAVLGGDGVGPEVMAEALRCLEKLADLFGHEFTLTQAAFGGARENGVSTEHFQIVDIALFVDGRFDLHCTLFVNRERGCRILGLNALDQKSLGYALREFHGCQRGPGNARGCGRHQAA